MERLKLLRNQLDCYILKNKEPKYVKSAYDYLNFDQFLNKDERDYRKKLREYLEKEIIPRMPGYLERQEFPTELVKAFLEKFPGLLGLTNKGYGSANFSYWLAMAVILEISRADMSLATFVLVHGGEIVMKTLYLLASEDQKKKYLPRLMSTELIGSFCLTEPDFGSDAYSITTTAKEDEDGNYIINGKKKWIGNATQADLFIVWAKNVKSGQIEGFLVDRSEGVVTKKIEGKVSLRVVQNAEITFTNVKVPKESRLEKAKNFKSSVSKVFLTSRIGVGWAAVGISIGAYDKAIQYLSERQQFGKHLTSFQLVQEKLARMMGNIQASLYFCKRVSDLYLEGKATMGKAGLCKGWCTSKGRETVALARELLGANGILYENYVMKAFVDMESVYTFEGTYDINMLLAGKELTGINAII